MKLESNGTNVTTNSDNEIGVTINATAQAFDILSSGIYKYEIAAIVRELISNAYDSHRDAGKLETPFVVHLPTVFHPFFEVEDFGLGLDHEDVCTVVTSYFKSTKQGSDDDIGGFGLGFKTPYAYSTRTFNVTATKDGIQRTYAAYISDDGAPKLNKILEVETDACNGVKIVVPVDDTDRYEFVAEAQYVLSFFPEQHTVNIDITYAYDAAFMKKLDSDKFVVTDWRSPTHGYSNLYSSRDCLYAVVGPVCYHVGYTDIFESDTPEYTMMRNIIGVSGSRVGFVKFDIGEVDIAPSREALRLTKKTKKSLQSYFVDKIERIKLDVQKEIDECDNVIEAINYIKDFFVIHEPYMSMFTYRGRTVEYYAKRRMKIPYVGDNFHNISNKRGAYLPKMGDDNVDKKIIIVIPDVDKRTYQNSYNNYFKDVTLGGCSWSYERASIVGYTKRCITPNQVTRLKKYIGEDRCKIVYISEMIADIKLTRTKKLGSSVAMVGKVGSKNEVRCNYIKVTKSDYYDYLTRKKDGHNYNNSIRGSHYTNSIIDLNELLNDGKSTILHMRKIYKEYYKSDGVCIGDSQNQVIFTPALTWANVNDDENAELIIIVSPSKPNKKVTKAGIKFIDEYVTDVYKEKEEEFDTLFLNAHIRNHDREFKTSKLLCELNIDFSMLDNGDVIENMLIPADTAITKMFKGAEHRITDLLTEEMRDISDKKQLMSVACDTIESMYPLLYQVDTYKVDLLNNYIEQVDFYLSNK